MLARRMSSILPRLTREEALEVTKIYSIAGLLPPGGGLITERPFRSPHHTTSMVAMIGGGSVPRPGEVTLSHHGVLFLDELPEFSKRTLEVLRQPLEDRAVTIARIHATLTFPSNMILVCAMNPCPCGYYGDEAGGHVCDCTPTEIKRYTRKISGPLLDRIDIHIRVPRVRYEELSATRRAESSAAIRARVETARRRQRERLAPYHLFHNAQMNHAVIRETCPPAGRPEPARARLPQIRPLGALVRPHHQGGPHDCRPCRHGRNRPGASGGSHKAPERHGAGSRMSAAMGWQRDRITVREGFYHYENR